MKHMLSSIFIVSLAAVANADNSSTSCSVAGITWSNGFKYLTGQAGVYPSIYAKCTNGVASCFRQSRLRDMESDPIECNEQDIHNERRRLGVYAPYQTMTWPKGVLCYAYQYSFSADQKNVITKAMDEYHQKTSLRFMTLDECRSQYGADTEACGGCKVAFNFVYQTDACYATIGYSAGGNSYSSGNNILNLGPSCFGDPRDGGHITTVHEMGHVAGLAHEHTHPQRQVVVLRNEILASPGNYMTNHQFEVTSYDRQSIMHYARYAGLCIPKDLNKKYCDVFDQNGENGCVVATSDDCDTSQDNSFGTSPGLAPSDIATLAKLYGGSSKTAGSNQQTQTPSITSVTTAPTPQPPATMRPSTTTAPPPTPPTTSPLTTSPSTNTNSTLKPLTISPSTNTNSTLTPLTTSKPKRGCRAKTATPTNDSTTTKQTTSRLR